MANACPVLEYATPNPEHAKFTAEVKEGGLANRLFINFWNPSLKASEIGRNIAGYYRNVIAAESKSGAIINTALRSLNRGGINTPRIEITRDGAIKGLSDTRPWKDVFRDINPFDASSKSALYIERFKQVVDEVKAMAEWVKETRGLDSLEVSDFWDSLDNVWDGLYWRSKQNPEGMLHNWVKGVYEDIATAELRKAVRETAAFQKVPTLELANATHDVARAEAEYKKTVLAVGKRYLPLDPANPLPKPTLVQLITKAEQNVRNTLSALTSAKAAVKGQTPPDITGLTANVQAKQAAAKQARIDAGETYIKVGGNAPKLTPTERLQKAQARVDEAQKRLNAASDPAAVAKAQAALQKALAQQKAVQASIDLLSAQTALRAGKDLQKQFTLVTKLQAQLDKAQAVHKMYKAREVLQQKQEVLGKAKKALGDRIKAGEKFTGDVFGRAGERISLKEWSGGYMPADDVAALDSLLRGTNKTAIGFFKAMEVAGDFIRAFSAGLDFATPFIHGLPLLFKSPELWGKATAAQYRAFFDPAYLHEYLGRNKDVILRMADHAVPINEVEQFDILRRGNRFEQMVEGRTGNKLPTSSYGAVAVRQTYGRFAAAFDTFGAIARVELWKAGEAHWQNLDELAAHVRNMTGALDSRALGVTGPQRAFESMWMAFSPRLLRSTVALLTDALQFRTDGPTGPIEGLEAIRSNPFEAMWGSNRGGAARQALAKVATGAVAAYVGAGMLAGKDFETEIAPGLNPLAGKKFLSYQVDNDWIGVGGQIRAIVQLLGKTGSAVYAASQGDESQLENFTTWSNNPLVDFYRSRGAVGLSVAQTMAEGMSNGKWNADPYDRIDSPWSAFDHLGSSAIPFSIQGRLEGQGTMASLANILGARTSHQTPYEVLSDERGKALDYLVSSGKFTGVLPKSNYNDLGPFEQQVVNAMVKTAAPGVYKAYEENRRVNDSPFQQVADTVDGIRKEYFGKMDAVMQNLLSAPDGDARLAARKQLDTLETEMYAKIDQARKDNKEYQSAIEGLSRNSIQSLVDYYKYTIVENYTRADGSIDWSSVEAARGAFWSSINQSDPQMATRLLFNAENSLTPEHPLQTFERNTYRSAEEYKSIEDPVAKNNYIALHPDINVSLWVLDGTALHSTAAVQQALDISQGRPVRFSNSSTIITPENFSSVQAHSTQVDTILNTDRSITVNGKEVRPLEQMRRNSLEYDAIAYWLGLYEVVYHPPVQITQWLTQNGFGARTDGKPPRTSNTGRN